VVKQVAPSVREVKQRVAIEREVAADFAASGRTMPPTPFDRSIPTQFRTALTRRRRFSCESFSLDDVRNAGRPFGATINDVFLSCVAGSLHRHFEATGRPLSRSTIATMALSTKPLAERQVAGNWPDFTFVWMHAHLADPLERLRATQVSARETKDHFARRKEAEVMRVLEIVPEWMRSLYARQSAAKPQRALVSNVVVSNVPGPRDELYLGRWRLHNWFSTGQVLPGLALNFTGWSYCDQFNVCVLADASAVNDTWAMIDGFRESLRELIEVADRQEADSWARATNDDVGEPTLTGRF
jgi:WS/DGAT/MGAT family acyltransferase